MPARWVKEQEGNVQARDAGQRRAVRSEIEGINKSLGDPIELPPEGVYMSLQELKEKLQQAKSRKEDARQESVRRKRARSRHKMEFEKWLREEVEEDSDPEPPKSGGGLTDSQRSVLNYSRSDAVLVCACAGSGKTHTMIHKICHLVDKGGVNPREIWVLSFTNAAVNEARRRLSLAFHEEGIDEDDLAVQVMTIDSLAAKINFEATGTYIAGGGYDESIREAMIRCKDYIQNLVISPSYVLIDESQDLETPRVGFIDRLMRSLTGSQFTLFFDRHQAIYGWSPKTEEQDDLDGGLQFLKALHKYNMELNDSAPPVIRLDPILFRAGNDAIHDFQARARGMIRGSTDDPALAAKELSDLLKGAGS